MTQELIERLEPCPFCGSTDVTMYASNGVTQGDPLAGGSRSVECNDCGATGPAEPSPRIGTAWNTRDQSQSARIAELEGEREPKPWIDEQGTLRAPEGFHFTFVDAPGSFDTCGYPLKHAKLTPNISLTKDSTSVTKEAAK